VEPGFDYWGGEVVRLLEDHPNDGLKVGDAGYVWGVYNVYVFEGLAPPFYEATFYAQDGTGIDMMFTADQVERVDDPTGARIPDDAREFWRRMAERHVPS